MTQLLEKLTKFLASNQQSRLEQYINSKRPTNAAEVEYWTRQYESNNTIYWGRGLWNAGYEYCGKASLKHVAKQLKPVLEIIEPKWSLRNSLQ